MLGMTEQEIELAADQPAESLYRGEAYQGQRIELLDHRFRGKPEGGLVEPDLVPVVIVNQLLVDPGTPGDAIGAGAGFTLGGEFAERRGQQTLWSWRGAVCH
jgi:hypothetical protein